MGVLVTCTHDGHTSTSACSSDCRKLQPRGENLRGLNILKLVAID